MNQQKKKNKSILRQIGISFLVIIASIWVIFEEWVWDHISSLMAKISSLRMMDWFKRFIVRLNPYVILLFFAIPIILLLPVKLLALYLLASGKIGKGLLVLFTGKIIGTAIAAQLFFITKDRLLTIKLFSKLYYFLSGIKQKLYDRLHKTNIYQKIHRFKLSLKTKLQNFKRNWKERFSNQYGILFTLKVLRQRIKKKD